MRNGLIWKSLDILTKRQTNILTAAYVIMGTTVLSLVLGLVKKRLLISLFGTQTITGVYDIAYRLPDLLFQVVIASALSSAFIPVFSNYLAKKEQREAHAMASNLLTIGMVLFFLFGLILMVMAPVFLRIFNPGGGFSPDDMNLMANLMRIIIFGQLLIIIGTFFTAVLQSYNHFFIPGFALALYNLGIIIGLITLTPFIGIYSGAVGTIIGAILFILFQLPLVRSIGFSYKPIFDLRDAGVQAVSKLMWPRTVANAVFQVGTIFVVSLISFLPAAGTNYIIFDLAQTIAFAPVALIGNAIAQAAFPILSREKENLENFKLTFINSFNQMLYLILPISVLLLVLRVPLVRLVFGASKLEWEATLLTGRILAFFSLSIFAQGLIALIYRAFYALHDTKTPLLTSVMGTLLMLILGFVFIVGLNMGVETVAMAFSVSGVLQLFILFFLLNKRTGGFHKPSLFMSWLKIFTASFFTAFALYLPIKLLDQLVFDTTKTINLIILTGISSMAGLSLYLFLTWFLNVKEASTYILAFKKFGNWKDALGKIQELVGPDKMSA
jgi:putative peptidoglycan lipid II flippase